MKSKILKALCVASLLGSFSAYSMNVEAPAANQSVNDRYQLTPLLGISTNLDLSVLAAMQEMQNAPFGEYRFHTAAKNSGRIIVFSTCDLMRNVGDCGFDALSLSRNTFADLFSNAFAEDAWNAYSQRQRQDLTTLLRNVVRYWAEADNQINNLVEVFDINEAFESILNGQLYNPEDLHDILNVYIDAAVRVNRPNGNLVSDLHDTHISLISYITGTRIITSSEHGLLEHLDLDIGNLNLNTAIDTVMIHNTGAHWLRSYMQPEVTDYIESLRNSGTTEGQAIVEAVKLYQIPYLHFPFAWNIPDMLYNNEQVLFYR